METEHDIRPYTNSLVERMFVATADQDYVLARWDNFWIRFNSRISQNEVSALSRFPRRDFHFHRNLRFDPSIGRSQATRYTLYSTRPGPTRPSATKTLWLSHA
jgi:hypothetical protein